MTILEASEEDEREGLQGSLSSESVGAHKVTDQETEEEEDESLCEDEAPSGRLVHASRIYRKDDGGYLVARTVASAIIKMSKAKRQPYETPFDQLSNRSLLKFEKGVDATVLWTRLKLRNGPRWDKVASPKRFLYAIEDLGHGAHGRVWLPSTSGGAVCALKFSLAETNLTKEQRLHDKKKGGTTYTGQA